MAGAVAQAPEPGAASISARSRSPLRRNRAPMGASGRDRPQPAGVEPVAGGCCKLCGIDGSDRAGQGGRAPAGRPCGRRRRPPRSGRRWASPGRDRGRWGRTATPSALLVAEVAEALHGGADPAARLGIRRDARRLRRCQTSGRRPRPTAPSPRTVIAIAAARRLPTGRKYHASGTAGESLRDPAQTPAISALPPTATRPGGRRGAKARTTQTLRFRNVTSPSLRDPGIALPHFPAKRARHRPCIGGRMPRSAARTRMARTHVAAGPVRKWRRP